MMKRRNFFAAASVAAALFALFSAVPAGKAQTPDPKTAGVYFKTDFPAEEFSARRAQVIAALEDDAVALIQGAPPVHGFSAMRQSNAFYYLTGVEVARAYLVLDGRTDQSILFLPHRNRRAERSEGRELSAEDEELLKQIAGVDRVLGPEAITETLQGAKAVYTPFQPAEGVSGSRDELRRGNRLVADDPWDGAPSREEHLRGLIAERVEGADIRDLSPLLDRLRAIKSPHEIAQLRRAGQLAALGINQAIKSTRPGLVEYQLDAAARYVFFLNGAQHQGYRSITASGENIINAHYHRNNNFLDADAMVLMDYSPDVGYYTSDIGRMWPVDGTYPPYMRELYGFVVAYHKIVLGVLRPGVTLRQLREEVQQKSAPLLENWKFSKPAYRAAAERLVERGGGDFSHAVGMTVHDVGNHRRGTLEPGMVFAIDPQLRVRDESLYIRIEDTIVITADGYENFTSLSPYDLDDVEAMMKDDGIIDFVPPSPILDAP